MKQANIEPTSEQTTPEVFSSVSWQFDSDTVLDTSYGVPDEAVVDQVRTDLLKVLEEREIDPATVVFSGYAGESHKKESEDFDVRAQIQKDILMLGRKANSLFAQGKFDENPELKERYARKLDKLRSELDSTQSGTSEYYFNNVAGLKRPSDAHDNPIHFATVTETATIGVYDLAKLGSMSVSATPAEIDEALILNYRPRYVDENGQPFED